MGRFELSLRLLGTSFVGSGDEPFAGVDLGYILYFTSDSI